MPRNHDGMACFDGPRQHRAPHPQPRAAQRRRRFHAAASNGAGAPALRRESHRRLHDARLRSEAQAPRAPVRQHRRHASSTAPAAGRYRNGGWLTCEETVGGRQQRLRQAARLQLPRAGARRLGRAGGAAHGDGPLRQGSRGRRRARRRLPDRGRRQQLRLLPLHARTAATTSPAGGMLQMLGGRPATRPPTSSPARRVGVRLPVHVGRRSRSRSEPRGRRAELLRAGPRRRRRGVQPARRHLPRRRTAARCTSSRPAAATSRQRGQLWHYVPATAARRQDQLVLVFESPSGSVLDRPTTCASRPTAAILFCEDDASGRQRYPPARARHHQREPPDRHSAPTSGYAPRRFELRVRYSAHESLSCVSRRSS